MNQLQAHTPPDREICRRARLARDARFDGRFFTAVKTTGIYCRPICPVAPPKESNVEYFSSAVAAAGAGYRPCLRCRPDSAPGSWAWKGVDTTLERALRLIDGGALAEQSLPQFAARLGVGDRYLRKLFQQRIGVSPLDYALYQQCLFAKQLLHETELSVTDVAFASGFRSLRRFTDCFKSRMGLSAGQIRRRQRLEKGALQLKLSYRPPFAWDRLRQFLAGRLIEGMEEVGEDSYGRTFELQGARGHFRAIHELDRQRFLLELQIDRRDRLMPVLRNVRRVLDLDADTLHIEAHLREAAPGLPLIEGLRLPGIWSVFEAGVRAILGQQVSVAAARRLVNLLVENLGERLADGRRLFPSPAAVAGSELEFLKMPRSRRETLREFARWYASADAPEEISGWLSIKGIGRWTADYAAMRGASDPDIWLGGDLGVKKALGRLPSFEADKASPWRSYLTFQLWNFEPDGAADSR